MTPSTLPQSRKITQEKSLDGLGGLMGFVVAIQWAGFLDWSLSLVTVISDWGEPLLILIVAFYWSLWGGNTWLMHKRRKAFQWMFFAQICLQFPLLAFTATRDSEVFGYGIAAIGFMAYVFFSERSQKTFTRTMEEPTR